MSENNEARKGGEDDGKGGAAESAGKDEGKERKSVEKDAASALDRFDEILRAVKDIEEGKSSMKEGVEHRNVMPMKVYKLEHGELALSKGSVVDFGGDAIVNAANEGVQGGGGVDGAISRKGGKALARAREELPVIEGTHGKRCLVGDAVITIGGDLNASYVIHAVGPNYRFRKTLEEGDKELESAYKAAMRVAKENGLSTIGFSLLSAGIFRGEQSLKRIMEVAVQSIKDSAYPGLDEVHLCAFLDKELEALIEAAEENFS